MYYGFGDRSEQTRGGNAFLYAYKDKSHISFIIFYNNMCFLSREHLLPSTLAHSWVCAKFTLLCNNILYVYITQIVPLTGWLSNFAKSVLAGTLRVRVRVCACARTREEIKRLPVDGNKLCEQLQGAYIVSFDFRRRSSRSRALLIIGFLYKKKNRKENLVT